MALKDKALRRDIVEDSVFSIGRDFAKSLEPGIASTLEWKDALDLLKKAALEYSEIEKSFKISKDRKEFLEIKKKEEDLRKKAAQATKAEQDALTAIQRLKKAELDVAKKKLDIDRKKQISQKSTIKLTEKEKLEIRLLNRGKREAAIISSKLSTEYERQSVILTQLRRKYKDVALREGESSTQARRLQREILKLDAALKKVDANVGQFQRNVGNYPKALRSAASAARALAGALGLTSAAFLTVQVIRDAIKVVREFDKQMIAVQKTTNLSDREIKQFGKDVVKLGVELNGISTQGLLRSSEVAGQLGIKGSQNILKFAETLEKLTLTSDIAGEESARNFAKFIEVSQDTVENADRLGSVITELGNNFATTESQILKNTVEIQKGLSIYEASAQSVIGLGAATNALGSEAEASRGALQTAFKILNDGATTGENLDKILQLTGQTVKEFKEEFSKDSVSVFRKFIKGLSDSDKSGVNLSKTLAELGITEKRATTVVGSLAKNYETLEDALNRANQEYEDNNALNAEAAKSAESLDSKIGDLKDAFANLAIGVDQGTGAISNFFKKAIEGLTGFIEGLGQINKTATDQGVEAARAVINDFKSGTEIIEEETKGFIVRTIQESDKNITTLQERIEELKDSFLITESEDGKLRYFGVDFGENTLTKIKDLQFDLEKEKASRTELNKILLEEGRAKDKLATQTAKLAVESAAKRGDEINLERQIAYFQSLSVSSLKKINQEYSRTVTAVDEIGKSEKELERERKKAQREAERQAELNQKNKNNLDNFRLEQQIKEQEEILKNEDEAFAVREIALAERARVEIELAKQIAKQKIEEVKGQADAITLIEENLSKAIKDINAREEVGQDEIELARFKQRGAIEKAAIEKKINDEIRLENEAFLAKEGVYADFENAVEERERRIAEIKKKYALEALDVQVKAIEALLLSEDLSVQDRIEAEARLAKLKNDISDIRTEHFISNNDKQVISEAEKTQQILDISADLSNALGDLANTIFDSRIQKIDDEIAKNDEKFERLLDNENLSASERKDIEERREKEREALEAKKRKEQRKQALLNKAFAVADIGIRTAQAIIGIWAQVPKFDFGVSAGALTAFVSALGALQIGTVLAQKIPQYFKGTDNHPGGLALVGEVRPEVIQEPNKKPYVVSKPTIMDLPSRTVVTPSLEEYHKIFRASTLASLDMEDRKVSDHQARMAFNTYNNINVDRLEKEMAGLRKDFKALGKRPNVFKGKLEFPDNYNEY